MKKNNSIRQETSLSSLDWVRIIKWYIYVIEIYDWIGIRVNKTYFDHLVAIALMISVLPGPSVKSLEKSTELMERSSSKVPSYTSESDKHSRGDEGSESSICQAWETLWFSEKKWPKKSVPFSSTLMEPLSDCSDGEQPDQHEVYEKINTLCSEEDVEYQCFVCEKRFKSVAPHQQLHSHLAQLHNADITYIAEIPLLNEYEYCTISYLSRHCHENHL